MQIKQHSRKKEGEKFAFRLRKEAFLLKICVEIQLNIKNFSGGGGGF
ncbi:hypothetical protein AusDCA_4459 [Desulfitobacterium sp. AusDCA]